MKLLLAVAMVSLRRSPRLNSQKRPRARGRELQPAEVGIDEAGRGPLAGPVVCAACYLPQGVRVDGVQDSKTIHEEEAREEVYGRLVATQGVRFAIAKAEPGLIDEINILQATLAAMRLAGYELCKRLATVSTTTDDAVVLDCTALDFDAADLDDRYLALVDGNQDPWKTRAVGGLESRPIIGGDASVPVIAAASILAKVTRDRIMRRIHDDHPEYDFAQNKGYGTVEHRRVIAERGWIPGIHRTSFNPVKSMIARAASPSEENEPPEKKTKT